MTESPPHSSFLFSSTSSSPATVDPVSLRPLDFSSVLKSSDSHRKDYFVKLVLRFRANIINLGTGMKKHGSSVPSSGKKIMEEESEDLESSSSDDSLDSEEENIERELADVTFEELQRARSDGSHSMYQKTKKEKKGGRANKNRPMEVSSRKPVSRFREVIQAPKNVVRDPRFESLSGNLDVDGFKKRYSFIYENNLPAEKEELKKQLRKTNDPNVVEELKKQLSWIDKQFKSDSTKRVDAAILAKHKKKEREAAKHGKKPFYLKKSEIRKQRLVEKYTSLKSTGKLDAYVERRRRKNAAKDRRYIPYQRSSKLDEQD